MPISELLFGTLTQNRSSLEPPLEFAVIAGPPRIVHRARYKSATIITSQLDVKQWHAYLDDPTLADAILDRIVHNAYHLNLSGESIRKLKAIRPKNAGNAGTQSTASIEIAAPGA